MPAALHEAVTDGHASSSPGCRRKVIRGFAAAYYGALQLVLLTIIIVYGVLASLTRERRATEQVHDVVTRAVNALRDLYHTYLHPRFVEVARCRHNTIAMEMVKTLYAFMLLFIALVALVLATSLVVVLAPAAFVVDVIMAAVNPEPKPQRSMVKTKTSEKPKPKPSSPPLAVDEPSSTAEINGPDDVVPDKLSGGILLLVIFIILHYLPSRGRQLGDFCKSDAQCASGLYCHSWNGYSNKCVRTTVTNPFKTFDTSLPFNKYAFLTTHNSFAITRETRLTWICNQEDSVTHQLNNGVRALMLDVYDYDNNIWLCHMKGGTCYGTVSFVPLLKILIEIEGFLDTNPSEIVTVILEDYVSSHKGLTKIFNKTRLVNYWFPVEKMPWNGEDWPTVKDMIKNNHRLLVFTSNRSKESSEGIAYQWNYMVENEYGTRGMDPGACPNRLESSLLSDKTKSLVFMNYFRTYPSQQAASMDNSHGLLDVLKKCHDEAGNRWANFIAVDFYKRSDGRGVFHATDMLNGQLICGRDDVSYCRTGPVKKAFNNLLLKIGLTRNDSEKHHGGSTVAPEVIGSEEQHSKGREVELSKGDSTLHIQSTQVMTYSAKGEDEGANMALIGYQEQILHMEMNQESLPDEKEDPKYNPNDEAGHRGLKLRDNELNDEL